MKTVTLRRHLRGYVLSGVFVLAICVGIVLFGARRGANAALIGGMVVGLSIAAGLATVVPRAVVAIELGPAGLVLRFPFARVRRLPLAALKSARVTNTPIGHAAPDGGRTRMVQLLIEQAKPLTVTDAEFSDVAAWIAALQELLGDRFEDDRDDEIDEAPE